MAAFKGGAHDMTVFRNGLKDKMLQFPGKMLIGDSIFKSGEKFPEEDGMFAPPSSIDKQELKHFKSRVRCRHETPRSVRPVTAWLCFVLYIHRQVKHGPTGGKVNGAPDTRTMPTCDTCVR